MFRASPIPSRWGDLPRAHVAVVQADVCEVSSPGVFLGNKLGGQPEAVEPAEHLIAEHLSLRRVMRGADQVDFRLLNKSVEFGPVLLGPGAAVANAEVPGEIGIAAAVDRFLHHRRKGRAAGDNGDALQRRFVTLDVDAVYI